MVENEDDNSCLISDLKKKQTQLWKSEIAFCLLCNYFMNIIFIFPLGFKDFMKVNVTETRTCSRIPAGETALRQAPRDLWLSSPWTVRLEEPEQLSLPCLHRSAWLG